MSLYLYFATLQSLSAFTLYFMHINCSVKSSGAADIDEADKRAQIDTLTWITLAESVLLLNMVNKKYRNMCMYGIILLLCVRLHDKGVFDKCVSNHKCPTEAETMFDFSDVCRKTELQENIEFGKKHFWSNSYNLCNVPDYYSDCKKVETINTKPDDKITLRKIQNLYQCYVWGCSYEITPIRFCLKWFTTVISCASLSLASFDWSRKQKEKNQ